MIADTRLCPELPEQKRGAECKGYHLPLTRTAIELGSERVANIVALGALAVWRLPDPPPHPQAEHPSFWRSIADGVTTISTVLRDRTLGLGVPAGKITIIPSGADMGSGDIILLMDLHSSARIFELMFSMDADFGATTTFDLSNFNENGLIDLRPGQWLTFSRSQLADLNNQAPAGTAQFIAQGNIYNSLLYQGNTVSEISGIDKRTLWSHRSLLHFNVICDVL